MDFSHLIVSDIFRSSANVLMHALAFLFIVIYPYESILSLQTLSRLRLSRNAFTTEEQEAFQVFILISIITPKLIVIMHPICYNEL